MPSGIVSLILNSDTTEMGETYCLLICNYLKHKISVFLKIHKDVESNSAPRCYVFISKSNSSKLLDFGVCMCNTEDIEGTDLRKKKVLFSKSFHRSAAV